jgi:hypothetical protein
MDALTPFSSADATAMRWIRAAPDQHAYELRAGDVLLGRMTWDGRAGSVAHVSLATGDCTVKRGGFLQPHVTLRDSSGKDRVRLMMHLTHGSITVEGGRAFVFRRAGLLVPAWKISEPTGRLLVHFEPVAERTHLQGGLVQVDPTFVADPALPWLVVMGWYFIHLAWFEDEALHASESLLSAASG